MAESFDSQIRIPPVSSPRAVDVILDDVRLFNTYEEKRRALAMLEQAGFGGENSVNVGVKKLLSVIEMARQEEDGRAERLVAELRNLHSVI